MSYRRTPRKKTVVLTQKLARDFNEQVGKHLEDNIRLRELMLDIDQSKYRKKRFSRTIAYPKQSKKLSEYLSGLTHQEHAIIIKTMQVVKRRLLVASQKSEIDKTTIGYLRSMSIDDLKSLNGIGQAASIFLKIAFSREV